MLRWSNKCHNNNMSVNIVLRGLRSTYSLSRSLLAFEPLTCGAALCHNLATLAPLATQPFPLTRWTAQQAPQGLHMLPVCQVRGLRAGGDGGWTGGRAGVRTVAAQEMVQDTAEDDQQLTKEVLERVNEQVRTGECGRVFAVVFVQGKQHLVTPEDLIVVQGVFPPNIGDKLRLEKVLCVGGRDFTVYGRPLLRPGLVQVEATVVEKTLSHCRIDFYNRRRKNSRKTKFLRETHTLLRINRVEVTRPIEEVPEVEGIDGKIF